MARVVHAVDVEITGELDPSLAGAVGMTETELKRIQAAAKPFNQLMSKMVMPREAAQAANQINSALTKMETRSSEATRRMRENFEKVGEAGKKAAEKIQESLAKAFDSIVEHGMHLTGIGGILGSIGGDLVNALRRTPSETVEKARPNVNGSTQSPVTVVGGSNGQRASWVGSQAFDTTNGGVLNVNTPGLLEFAKKDVDAVNSERVSKSHKLPESPKVTLKQEMSYNTDKTDMEHVANRHLLLRLFPWRYCPELSGSTPSVLPV